jgi:hypothetical protein
MAVNDLITFRKGPASQWISVNPVLASGEPGYDLTNSILKIGDGVSNWVALSGIGSTSVGGSSSSSVGVRGSISTTGTLSSFNVSGGYSPGYLDLFQNGVKLLSGSDFTATDGTLVTLSNSVPSGTVLEYVSLGSSVSSSNYTKLDNISSSFNGSSTSFGLAVSGTAYYPVSANTLGIYVGGVAQEPISSYSVSGSNIVFTEAPASGLTFWGVGYGTTAAATLNGIVPGSSGFPAISSSNDLTTGFYFPSSGNISVAGNLGIGTSSPSSKLHVVGNITATSGNFSQNLQINGTAVSVSGHNHIINDVSGLQTALDSKQVSGSYAASSHTHSSSNITDFNSSVSGLLPITNIIAGNGIDVAISGTTATITSNDTRWNLFLPAAPTNLTATGGNGQASLSWTAPSGVISQAPITDYSEQYSADSGTTWTTFSAASSTATSGTITGLTNGTEYVFRVAAINIIGIGAYTIASSPIRPGTASAPTGLTATAGNAQIVLTWTAPSNTGASSITGYTVEYTPSGGSAQTVSTGSAGTSYTLTGLTNGTTYTVRVAAVSAVGTGTYSTASNAVTPRADDPYFSSVSVLLHMDGTGSSFVDSSSSPKTITVFGDASQSATQSKFGGKSLTLDGSGDYISIADSGNAFAFGTGDFCYELWFRSNASNSYAALLTRPYFSEGGILISLNGSDGNGAPEIYWRQYANNLFFASNTSGFNDNNWHHYVFNRSGTTCRMFIDGIVRATRTGVSTSVGSSQVVVGNDISFNDRQFSGYIDELRITNGYARYEANFSPAAISFSNS